MRKYNFTIFWLITFCHLLFNIACQNSTRPASGHTSTNAAVLASSKFLSDHNNRPLLKSLDYGLTWTDAALSLPDGVQVSFLEITGDGEMLIATDNAGLFIGDPGESEWRQIGSGLPGQKLNALHVHKEDIMVGVYQQGIYKTTDKGQHWQSLNYDLPDKRVQAILTLKNKILIGTDSGFFTLESASDSWIPGDVSAQVVSLYQQGNNIIAGSSRGSLRSVDAGNSWEWISENGAVHYTHGVDDRIYELKLNGDLNYTDDLGNTWASMAYEPRDYSYIYEIVQAGPYLLLSNNYGIHRSEDNGLNWKLIFADEKNGFFDLIFSDTILYAGTRNWDEYRKRK